MIDYKLLEAFYFVINDGGFEKASQNLCITQSAVSQRIKLLEEQSGQVLLIRSNPPRATDAGERYLNHYLNVKNLEINLLNPGSNSTLESVKVGLNADSLATWFMPMVTKFLPPNIVLDLNVDDQDKTIEFLKSGEVVAAITTYNRQIQGCTLKKLGTMEYSLLSTPDFREKWFPEGFTGDSINKAPAILYNKDDNLHDDFFKLCFDSIPDYPRSYIPSSEQFLNFILDNRGYGLVPLLQGEDYINDGTLIEIIPENTIDVELYLHRWNHLSEATEFFLNKIIGNISNYLY